jgi:peroxiredoxin
MLDVGALAPHFTLLGIDGREYSVPRDISGKPALFMFFKITCPTCDITFPYINRLRELYPDDLNIWAIAQDPPDKAREYSSQHRIEYPVLIDAPTYTVSKLYDPAATPTLFLVDERGRVAYSTYGFVKDDLNEVASLVATSIGAEALTIAPADDGQPAFKPG